MADCGLTADCGPGVAQRNSHSRACGVIVLMPRGPSFARMKHNQKIGEMGERIAARWLATRGWQIRERRFRNGRRDIDLIIERERTIAFVEVKARAGSEFGDPVEAVHWRKQRELRRSAQVWIDRHGQAGTEYRFDVVGVLLDGGKARLKHVENAFKAA